MKTPDLFFSPSPKQSHWFVGMALVGGCCLGTGLFFAPDRVWPTFLLLNYYLLGLGLAGLVFIAIQYVTDAGWCVAFSRVPEALLNLIPFASVGLLTIWFVHPSLYPWVETARDEIHGFKRIWLNYPFFLCRSFLYLLVWNLFAWLLIRNSRRQDEERDLSYTYQNTCLSAVFLVAFAITFCLASFDWIMSLEPEWYSTIFGIYHFAGMFQSGLAIIVILSVWVNRSGIVQGMVTEDHLHDLGKLLFAFCTFWIYIWFSQYLLIWYANIPEETVYFIPRVRGMWGSLFLLNIFLNWIVPFLVLLPRHTKRNAKILVKVAVVVLAGRWLDLYLMIIPTFSGPTPVFGVWEIGLTLGAIGCFFSIISRSLQQAPIVPINHPYLNESLSHHQ